jgi:cell division protein FtsW
LSRHLLFLVIAVGLAVICAFLPENFWFRAAPLLFTFTIGLLVLVLIPGVGTRVNGAQRWLRFGSFSVQPSEIVKVTLPLLTARLLYVHREKLRHWFIGTIPMLIPVGLIVPLVILQPDLGTAIFLCGGFGIAMFVGNWPIRNFVITGGLLIPACFFLVSMRPYQVERISGFVSSWSDINKAPYQMKQSMYSLGAGGLQGVGIGKGAQKLSFLPEANTDFVFAVVGEELGLLGTLGLIGVWLAFLVMGLRLLRPLNRNSFEFIASFTLLMQLVFQAAINVAVVTAMVPPKGISHPLVSYGGSNLVVSLISLGIVFSLTRDSSIKSELALADSQGEM